MKILNQDGTPFDDDNCAHCAGKGCKSCDNCVPFTSRGGGSYGGAKQAGLFGWYAKYKPEDENFKTDRRKVVARAIDQFRNDALTQGGVNEVVNLAVTDNWRVTPCPDYLTMGWSEQDARKYSREWRRNFERDMKSSSRYIDASGKKDHLELYRLDLRSTIIGGESYVKFNRVKNENSPIGYNMQVINEGRIATPSQFENDQNVFEGIRKTFRGYERGYYVFDYHIGSSDVLNNVDRDRYRFVRSKNRFGEVQMIHNMIEWTPDLTRGMSMLHAQLIDIKKKNKMKDAGLDDMIAKAQIALVITSNKKDIAEAFGIPEMQAEQMKSDVDEYMESSADWHENMGIQYGNNPLLRLYDGERLDGFAPPNSAGHFEEFNGGINSDNARTLGLSNEMYTQRWDKTNFSGARSGVISVKRNIGVMRQQIPVRTSQCNWEVYLADGFLSGKFSMPGNPSPAEAYLTYLNNVDAIAQATWSGGAWDEIDPSKTGAGFEVRKRLGLHTFQDGANSLMNRDWDEICDIKFAELDDINARLEKRGYSPIKDPINFLFPGFSEEGAPVGELINNERTDDE